MAKKPKLLDLFCGAGGAAMGYSRAGFEVIGIDITPQPHYPFQFATGDALQVLEWMRKDGKFRVRYPSGREERWGPFDAIHASPPCHYYSTGTRHRKNQGVVYPDLLPGAQQALDQLDIPYVIENVVGARSLLRNPVMLCGGMFRLGVRRHRLFEVHPLVGVPSHTCNLNSIDSDAVSVTRHGPPARWYRNNPGASFNIKRWHDAMDIHWMPRFPLTQAIPPAYTEYIGRQLLQHLQKEAVA